MSHPQTRPRPRRANLRGFTLAEMLAVIAMISILAVAASPVFVSMMRDRRVNRAAFQLVDMVRTARMRAIGRNLPVQLAWNVNGGNQKLATGLLTMTEPVVGLFANTSSCLGAFAVGAPGAVQEVARFDLGNGLYENAQLKLFDAGGVEQPTASLCFSGRGATYITVGGVAGRLAGPVTFSVTNKNGNITGLVRRVFVPPNGAARIAL
ncbi:MAG: prepilin-type N-terminal cleavage/methylation domain-containing protein [Byssovorax sp.]